MNQPRRYKLKQAMDLILNANNIDCNDDDNSQDSDVKFSVKDAYSNWADSSDDKSDSDDDEPLTKLVGASVQQSSMNNKVKKKEYTWRKGTFNPPDAARA